MNKQLAEYLENLSKEIDKIGMDKFTLYLDYFIKNPKRVDKVLSKISTKKYFSKRQDYDKYYFEDSYWLKSLSWVFCISFSLIGSMALASSLLQGILIFVILAILTATLILYPAYKFTEWCDTERMVKGFMMVDLPSYKRLIENLDYMPKTKETRSFVISLLKKRIVFDE